MAIERFHVVDRTNHSQAACFGDCSRKRSTSEASHL